MKKLSILSMLLLFISMGNIQAQTVKEESRKQKKAEQELLDQMFFDEAKQAIEDLTGYDYEHCFGNNNVGYHEKSAVNM